MVKSNTATILVAAVATLLFGLVTWWVVEVAGGTKIDPAYSNTPNATVPGAPPFK